MNDNGGKKKIIVTVMSFFILTVGIIAGTILTQQKQDIRENAAPMTNLSFNPETSSVIRGQTFNTNVKIDTGANVVTGIDIELTYNPAVIQITEIVPTSVLSSFTGATGQIVKNEINNTTGKARFVAYTQDKTLGINGVQNILTLSGSISTNTVAGSYQINYGGLTAIAALNEEQNALLNKTPLTLTVTLPTASPSPSPTASPVVFRDWDVVPDRKIDVVDIGVIVDNYGLDNPLDPRADVDKANGINVVDIGIVINHFDEIY